MGILTRRDLFHPPFAPVSFVWAFLGADGEEVGRSGPFPDREAAEDWMGESWQDLLERGVEEVALRDEDRGTRVYRMGLREG